MSSRRRVNSTVRRLAEEFGATDSDGCVESSDDLKVCEERAKEWQASKSAE